MDRLERSIRRRQLALLGAGLAVALAAVLGGVAGFMAAVALGTVKRAAPAREPVQVLPSEDERPAVVPLMAAEDAAPHDDGGAKLLESAPLDPEVQAAIFSACGGDLRQFAFVMAIAEHESRFQPKAISADGQCFGLMQIKVRCHRPRLDDLGVTDILDPAQNAEVGIDYLRELEYVYGFDPCSHHILMAYSMGPGKAIKQIALGQNSSAYSRAVMERFHEYLEELGAA